MARDWKWIPIGAGRSPPDMDEQRRLAARCVEKETGPLPRRQRRP